MNYREFIGCHLSAPLVSGLKYYINFKVACAYGGNPGGAYVATDKIGAMFSTVSYSEFNPAPINNFAHVFTDSVITDTLNWTTIQGTFIADSNYEYLSIGNFFNDLNTDTIELYPGGILSYYFVDDVCVSSDSAYCSVWSALDNLPHGSGTTLYYRNPVIDDYLNLKINNAIGNPDITIYNLTGKIVYKNVFINQNELKLDLSFLSAGVYIVSVQIVNSFLIAKIIKL